MEELETLEEAQEEEFSKEIARLIVWLRVKGFSEEQILDCITYVCKDAEK